MLDIYQTPPYARNQRAIGWQVVRLEKWQGFMKKIPILGTMLKIQRIGEPIPWQEIDEAVKKYQVKKIILEPGKEVNENKYLAEAIKRGYRKASSNFAPGRSILIDIALPTETIFHRFAEAKQRGVRRANKNNLQVSVITQPSVFVSLKKKSLWNKKTFPFWVDKEVTNYAKAFGNGAEFIIATTGDETLAGIFQLYSETTAYYWMAAATQKGKGLFAPTLLVWEAIKRAKEKGCFVYDFVGIYDPRYPNKDWLGFTKFKEGFGGKEVIYPQGTIKKTGLI